MEPLIPAADPGGSGLADPGWKVEDMVKWTYEQLPEPATVVMTNLSVGECTGIYEFQFRRTS